MYKTNGKSIMKYGKNDGWMNECRKKNTGTNICYKQRGGVLAAEE